MTPMLVLLIAVVSASLQAQAESPQPMPTQTVVDFIALDKDGRPVLDLSRQEVALKVDGRPRDIKFFQLLRADGRNAPAAPAVPPPFASNSRDGTMGRDVMVIIDEESISAGKQRVAQDAVMAFIASLGPGDRAALLSMRPTGPRINLSDAGGDVRQALSRFSAFAPSVPTDEPCRTIQALQNVQALFSGYSGRYRPTIVIVSGGLAPPPEGGSEFAKVGSRDCPLSLRHFQEAGTAARGLDGDIYAIYAPELTASATPEASRSSSVETLAGAAGAQFIQAVATIDALKRVATETSAHYIAAYDPQPGERAGARQRVELTVTRPDVKLRFRRELVATTTAAAAPKTVRPDDMLRASNAYGELPLQAAAFASRTEDGKIRLVVLFESPDTTAKIAAASVGLYDARNRLTRWSADKTDLDRTLLTAGIIVAPGPYRMRVAAVDAAGRAGTVDTDVVAELVDAAPVKFSGLVLGVSEPGGAFSPRLQFAGDSGAFGYLEIYGVPKGATVKAVHEIAQTVDGEALVSGDTPVAPGATEDARIAHGGFAIDKLPPGDVVMRVLITVDGKLAGRAVRTLRKTR